MSGAVFILYAGSAAVAGCVAGVDGRRWLAAAHVSSAGGGGARARLFTALTTASLLLFALGTALDNARTFAGCFAGSIPDGVSGGGAGSGSVNARYIAGGGGAVFHDAWGNKLVSWVCVFLHEVFGGAFVLSAFYIVGVVAAAAPAADAGAQGARAEGRCGARAAAAVAARLPLGRIAYSIAAVACTVGLTTFSYFSASGPLWLSHNALVDSWTFAPSVANPVGLLGVFVSSAAWIVAGVVVARAALRARGYWFLILQLVCLLGQGASAGVRGGGGALVSNALEQVTLWSIIGVLRWLPRGPVDAPPGARDDGAAADEATGRPLLA